ncbi:uncharacterized protein LOC126474294, partial [Schistocerca serialis cubense]|uniref:uncharacterized protein LOC126474294 n=1 Tax=Schistocerca serialis cubense TaxID=2023355 RepID=UPI00214ECB13
MNCPASGSRSLPRSDCCPARAWYVERCELPAHCLWQSSESGHRLDSGNSNLFWRIQLDQDLFDTIIAIYPEWFKDYQLQLQQQQQQQQSASGQGDAAPSMAEAEGPGCGSADAPPPPGRP